MLVACSGDSPQTPKPGATTGQSRLHRIAAAHDRLPRSLGSDLRLGVATQHAGSGNPASLEFVRRRPFPGADVWPTLAVGRTARNHPFVMIAPGVSLKTESESDQPGSPFRSFITRSGLFVRVLANRTLGCTCCRRWAACRVSGIDVIAWVRLPDLCVGFGLAFGAIRTALKAATGLEIPRGKSAKTRTRSGLGFASTWSTRQDCVNKNVQESLRRPMALVYHRGEDWRFGNTFRRRNASPGTSFGLTRGLSNRTAKRYWCRSETREYCDT